MAEEHVEATTIGTVRSTLRDLDEAPKQGDEGAPEARIELEAPCAGAGGGWGQATRWS